MTANLTSAAGDVYHPEWVAFENAMGGRLVLPESLEDKRAMFDKAGQDLSKLWPALDEPLNITDEVITPENYPVRIYSPESDRKDLPVMVYFHGGGFISGDLETEFPQCRILAAKTPCIIVYVDYPIAPKANIDQIIQCGLRTVEWTKSHNPPLSTSPTLLLGGGSAGGMLAVQLMYHLATHGDTSISGLVVIQGQASPAALTPYTGKYAEQHRSMEEKAEGAPFLNREAMITVIQTPNLNITNPAHFPLLAQSLTGFPRTYVVTAEHDPSRDDGKVLAKRIADESGVEVLEVCYEGMPHWFQWYPSIPMASVMLARTVKGIKFVLGQMSKEEAERWD